MSSNEIVAFVYCGVALVSAILLMFNARTVLQITARYSIERNVFFAVLFAGLASIFDCAYTLREMEVVPFSQTTSYVLTILYIIFISLCGMFWVYYSEKKQNSWFAKTKTRLTLYSLPMYALLLIVVTTPFTHLYFYFEDLHYQRGPLFIILSSLLFLYVVQTGIVALIRSFSKKHYVDRKEYRRLFAFAAVYMVVQVIQLVLPAIFPYRSVGMLIFFEVILIQNMQEMIGRDPLTHINNRFAAERQLGTMFSGNDAFEIVALDADKFKSINDQYGHQEGDKALQYVASVLKDSVDSACFIARMGGDEFIILNRDVSHTIVDIEEKLNNNLSALLEKQKRKYRFTVSAGYTLKDENIKSIPDLIELADKQLYIRKDMKKGQ